MTYTNQLLITGANGLTNVDGSEYRITYGFRVIGQPTGTVQAVPVAQISSGTQVKHSDTSATGGTLNITFSSLAINAALTKSVTATTGLTTVDCSGACAVPGGAGNGTYVEVPYRLTASTSTSTTQTVDEFVDQAPTGVIFKPSSASVTDIGRTGVAISDPVTITTDSAPKPIHFVGPFTLSSATNATINYTMYVPVGSYANTAYAKLGDSVIGATSSAMSRVTVTSTGTGTVGVVTDTVSLSVSAQTDPATSIDTTTATINGTVDPNGTSILTGQFEYGTSPTLTGATTVTATTPASGNLNGLTVPTAVSYGLTGLSSGTTYYFRVIAGAAQGSILSFTTLAVLAAPTTTTTAATSVTTTTATLNGTINPNLTPITGIQFVYGTVPNLSSGTTTVTVDDGSGTAALTAGGSTTQAFSRAITGLTTSTTYYFKIRACTSALTGTYPNVSCASFVDGSILNFTPGLLSRTHSIDGGSYSASYTLVATPPTITSTPSAGAGTKSYSSSTTGVCTIGASSGVVTFVSAGTCTIGASIAADGTYDVANAETVSFSVTLAPRTLAIDGGSYGVSYTLVDSEPTITSTPSAGAGTKSYSSSTTGVCTIGSSSGVVTFVSAGTCTIGASIAADGTYDAADADDISFEVTLVPRSIVIDDETYLSFYLFSDPPPTIGSDPSAGEGTKSYSSSTLDVCTIDELTGEVAFVDVGTCTIGVSIASDGTYDDASSIEVSFDVALASLTSRTLAIDSESYDSTYTLIDDEPTITSTQSAGAGTKSYSSGTVDVCTINSSSGLVTFVSPGTCTIGASIASDGTYATATAETISFEVTLAPRTLAIDAESYELTYSLVDSEPTITSTPSVGDGTKSYSSSTPGVCTVGEFTGDVTFVSAGTCTIGASIAEDGTYDAADADEISFEITAVSTPDLSGSTLTDDDEDDEVRRRDDVTYTLTIPNDGDGDATGISAYVEIDADLEDLTVLSITGCGDAADDSDATTLNLSLIDIASGEECVVIFRATVDSSASRNATIPMTVAVSAATEGGDGASPAADTLTVRVPSGSSAPSAPYVPPVEPEPEPEPDTTDEPDSTEPESDATETSETEGATDVDESETESTGGSSAPTVCACDSAALNLYIVNPDGTERHPGDGFVLVEKQSDGTATYRFEDKGSDMDFDDFVVSVDAKDCANVRLTAIALNAGWHHVVRLAYVDASGVSHDAVVWQDSQASVGATFSVGFALECPPPVVLICDASSFDLYIVNPDGTARHPGSGFVRVDANVDGTARYSFEDKGSDMDFNDFLVDVNANDCANVTLAAVEINAGWHHVVRLLYADILGISRDEIVWQDSHASIGNPRSFSVLATP